MKLKSLAAVFAAATALSAAACNQNNIPDAPKSPVATQFANATSVPYPVGPDLAPEELSILPTTRLDFAQCAQEPQNGWCKYLEGTREQLAAPLTPERARKRMEFEMAIFMNPPAYVMYGSQAPYEDYPAGTCGTVTVNVESAQSIKDWGSPYAQSVYMDTNIQVLPKDTVTADPDFVKDAGTFIASRQHLKSQPGSPADGRRALVGCYTNNYALYDAQFDVGQFWQDMRFARAQSYVETDNTFIDLEERKALAKQAIVVPAIRREP